MAAAPATTNTPPPPHPTHTSQQACQSHAHALDAHTHATPHAGNHTHTHGRYTGHGCDDLHHLTCTLTSAMHANRRPYTTRSMCHTHADLQACTARARTRRTQQNTCTASIMAHVTFDHPVPLTRLGQPGRTRAIWPAAWPHAREPAGRHRRHRRRPRQGDRTYRPSGAGQGTTMTELS